MDKSKVVPRPGRKIGAAKRECARMQLIEIWKTGKSEQLPPKVRLAIETLVPELGKVRHDQAKM